MNGRAGGYIEKERGGCRFDLIRDISSAFLLPAK